MSDKQKLSRLMGIKEAARLLNVDPITLRRWDKKNILRAVRVGERRNVGDRRYRPEDIKAFILKGLNRKR